jgi:hypothetical protein
MLRLGCPTPQPDRMTYLPSKCIPIWIKKSRTILICTTLRSYGSSIVLSSPLLLFRKHNIILFVVAPPPIDASTWAEMIGDVCWLWCRGEGTRLVTHARACGQDAQPSESAANDPEDGECFDDGGACATSPFCPSLAWIHTTAHWWPHSRPPAGISHSLKFRVDEPPFFQAASRCYVESACC